MEVSTRSCTICHRPLKNPDSIARGMGEFCARKIGLPVFGSRTRSKKPKSHFDSNQLALFKEPEIIETLKVIKPEDLIQVEEVKACKAIAKAFQKLWGDADVGPWIPESHEVQTVICELKRVALPTEGGHDERRPNRD